MRSSRARLFALLATLVALLAAAAPARAHYFCHMRERVVAECCCPKEPSHGDHGEGTASARAPDCCERLASVSRAAIAAPHDAAADVPSAAVIAIVPVTEYGDPLREAATVATALARAPPAIGPPAFISQCRLLI
jgi:hypothetical protein